MPQSSFPIPGEVVQWIVIGVACVTVILHLCFALAVWHDADLAEQERPGSQLLSPTLWALTALIFGLAGLMAYWVVNLSRLSPYVRSAPRPKRPSRNLLADASSPSPPESSPQS